MNKNLCRFFHESRKSRPLWFSLDDDPETLSRISLMIVLQNTARLVELYGMFILSKGGTVSLQEADRFIDSFKGIGYPLL